MSVRAATFDPKQFVMVIVIPTYNRAYCLERALASVEAQTFENWLCIILDDGSVDSTPEIGERWATKDRFLYFRYLENRGGVAMNEIGMMKAIVHGDAWTRLGADDYFEPHKLALDVWTLQNVASACWGPFRQYHDAEPHVRDMYGMPDVDATGALLSRGFAASWANIAVKTDILAEVYARHGRFCDPSIRNMEDWLVNTRIAYQAEFVWRGMTLEGHVIATNRETALAQKIGIIHDAVWRVGSDGASQNSIQCETDARRTAEVLADDATRFTPKPRETHFEMWRTDVRIPR